MHKQTLNGAEVATRKFRWIFVFAVQSNLSGFRFVNVLMDTPEREFHWEYVEGAIDQVQQDLSVETPQLTLITITGPIPMADISSIVLPKTFS